VRLRDAHAWCLVWNPVTKRWDDFDTTPASWVEEEKKHASAFQWLQDAWTRLGFEFAKLRWGQTNLRLYLLIGIAPALVVLLYQIIFRRGRRKRKTSTGQQAEVFDWPGLDSEFYQLEKKLAERGVPRDGSEPLNEWLARVATAPGFAELGAPLQEILRLHYRHRFDPLGLNETERDVLRREVRMCLESLMRMEQSELTTAK
jgi:protein-glutamine gamma-glutamyltransferase